MASRRKASLSGLAGILLSTLVAAPALGDGRPSRHDPLYVPAPTSPFTTVQFIEAVSVEMLLGHFDQAGYDLSAVRIGESSVPRLYTAALPKDLRRLAAAEGRKEAFLGAMLPLVLMANEEILQLRRRIEALSSKAEAGEILNAEELEWLLTIASHYETDPWDFDELLLRVDALPVSLTLAQAIEESGWGTSRYARDGNALFGQRTWRAAAPGMTARQDGKALDHRALAFADLMQSVRAYMHNLNTHRAYRKFRAERQRQRRAGELLDGSVLAGLLGSYAENDGYVANLRRLIRHNELDAYELARLAPGAVAEALAALAEPDG
jgi:Bax protein